MNGNKFIEKFIENIGKLDEINIKSVLESLENERKFFKIVFDYLDEGIILIVDNKVVFLNQKAKNLLITPSLTKNSYSLEEFKKNVGNIFLCNIICKSLEKNDCKTELIDRARENRYYQFEKFCVMEKVYIIKIKDITESKNMEFQLKNMESISALNTLAAGIAHEIKNPLTAIDLHIQIIKKAIKKKIVEASPEIIHFIEIIDEEQKRLTKIVNDFLTAARKRELNLSFEDINSYLQEIIKLIQPEIENNSIELVLEFNSIPKIFIDKDYLKQAFLNIFKNAIESMLQTEEAKEKGKILKIKTFYDNAMDAVGVSIQDNGTGIEEEKIQKIFEPYYTTKENGTGLGLTIVYKIVKEHGGDIKVESEKNKGSTFTIYLPLSKGRKLITGE